MTKTTLAALLIIGSLGSTAAMADNDVGCGWGTLIWQGDSGLFPKILASTTNGILGNQTFGISSGTLGCSQDGVIKADVRRTKFASANMDQLAAETAAGEGESLTTLAALYNVAPAGPRRLRQHRAGPPRRTVRHRHHRRHADGAGQRHGRRPAPRALRLML